MDIDYDEQESDSMIPLLLLFAIVAGLYYYFNYVQIPIHADSQPNVAEKACNTCSANTSNGPDSIVLMRSCECNTNEGPTDSLSQSGMDRAQRIANYVGNELVGTTKQRISVILTDKTKKSMMSGMPSAFAEQVPLYSLFDVNDTRAFAKYLMSNPEFSNQVVMVVWDHSKMKELLGHLKIKASEYEFDDYSKVYIVKDGKLTVTCQSGECDK